MLRNKWTITALAALLVLGIGVPVSGLINPHFTPKNLLKDADIVAEVEPKAVKNGKCEVVLKRLLQGKLAAKSITIDLSTSAFKEHAAALEKSINALGSETAILFAGNFQESDTGGAPGAVPADPAGEQKGYLHVAGNWAAITSKDGLTWSFDQNSATMQEVWRGGTDMLLRCLLYIKEDPENSDVPVDEKVTWAEAKQFGKIPGVVYSAGPVSLSADAKYSLFITADSGDRLFDYDQKAGRFNDVSAAKKLASKSMQYAWADFNGDGTLDLLSWNGNALTLYTQNDDGTFAPAQNLLSKADLGGNCLSLSAVDSGTKHRPGVIIGTTQGPKVFVPADKNSLKALADSAPASSLGSAGRCIVADLDGDAIPDVLQLFSKGSLLFRGKAAGQWNAPEQIDLAAGNAGSGLLGDFDADGLLDLLTISDDKVDIWQNCGKAKFVQAKQFTGEVAYNSPDGACCGTVGDINNDGRQEFALFYSTTAPKLFFNRGFRCFGVANTLDLTKNGMLPETNKGQQAGCWMDVNSDGAQDMVCIARDGTLGVVFRAVEGTARCVRVVLSPKASFAGPVTVSGWKNGRCLGAWNVVAGTSEGLVAQDTAGNIVLKWQLPGGKPQEKTIELENDPITFVLPE